METKIYEIASLEEYGYKDRKVFKKIFKIFNSILVVGIIILMYLSIFVIALQSVNASNDLSIFTHFTFDSYIYMFKDRMFANAVKNTLIVTIVSTLIATVFGTLI